MTTIGQNSPATPAPRVAVPSGVRRRPASERIGTIVPSAVVAKATPSSHPSRVDSPPRGGRRPPRGRSRSRRPPAVPERERAARHALLDHLQAREEEEEDEPDGGQELDVQIGVRDVERLGAHQDPEEDLHDHRGQHDPAMQPRDDRRDGRRGEDEDERADVGGVTTRSRSRAARCPTARNESPGSRRISASPLRNAFGGHVIGSTARLRRSTSGSGSPVNTSDSRSDRRPRA